MRRTVFVMGLAFVIAFLALRIFDPAPVAEGRLAYFDYLQRLKPRAAADLPVRVVDIDEASLAAEGQWPWPRDKLAELTDRLGDLGAAVITYDFLFPEADRLSPVHLLDNPELRAALPDGAALEGLATLDNDRIFAEAIGRNAVVMGTARTPGGAGTEPVTPKAGIVEVGVSPALGLERYAGSTPVLAPQMAAAAGIGSVSMSPGTGGTKVRTVPLAWNGPYGVFPSLALETLRVAYGETSLTIWGVGDVPATVDGFGIGEMFVPTLPDGSLWVRFRRDDPALYVSARDVLGGDPEAVRPLIEGNLVLVGTSAAGLLDIRTTAIGETVPGVSIHAQMIEQMLLGDYLQRTDAVVGLELLGMVVIGLLVVTTMALSGPATSILVGLVASGAVLGGSWYAFDRQGLLMDATFPLISGMLTYGALSAYRLIVVDREKRMIRKSFSHYVSPGVLHQIEAAGHRLALGGINTEVTVMFSDIRGFTPLSESLAADELVTLLNELFEDLGAQIMDERGTIDKFIGDAIMAFWNAPLQMEDHSRRGCLAALRMREALKLFNARRPGLPPIRTCVGLSTGPACVGNVGSLNRFNYSVIGDTVNVAARVEANCRHVEFDTVVTDAVQRAAPDLAMLDAGRIGLKGVSERMHVFALVGDAGVAHSAAFRALAATHGALLDRLAEGLAFDAELEACRAAAGGLRVEMGDFYDRIAGRLADFEMTREEAAEVA